MYFHGTTTSLLSISTRDIIGLPAATFVLARAHRAESGDKRQPPPAKAFSAFTGEARGVTSRRPERLRARRARDECRTLLLINAIDTVQAGSFYYFTWSTSHACRAYHAAPAEESAARNSFYFLSRFRLFFHTMVYLSPAQGAARVCLYAHTNAETCAAIYAHSLASQHAYTRRPQSALLTFSTTSISVKR